LYSACSASTRSRGRLLQQRRHRGHVDLGGVAPEKIVKPVVLQHEALGVAMGHEFMRLRQRRELEAEIGGQIEHILHDVHAGLRGRDDELPDRLAKFVLARHHGRQFAERAGDARAPEPAADMPVAVVQQRDHPVGRLLLPVQAAQEQIRLVAVADHDNRLAGRVDALEAEQHAVLEDAVQDARPAHEQDEDEEQQDRNAARHKLEPLHGEDDHDGEQDRQQAGADDRGDVVDRRIAP
jgi:hypothetical protein